MSRTNSLRSLQLAILPLAVVLGSIPIFLFMSSCQRDQIEGPVTYLLPWPDPQGEYHLQDVEVKTLRQADYLDGSAAQIYVSAGIKDGQFVGDIARPRLIPRGHHRFMPADVESALAIATYAHFERLQQLDRELGIESNLSWPRRVGVQMKIKLPDGEIDHNNARYFSKWDLTLVSPSNLEGLPIAMNGGVIAHEHFHAHFHASLTRALNPIWGLDHLHEKSEAISSMKTNIQLIRSWNEGLADYWGFLYSRDPRFISKTISMGLGLDYRRLDIGPVDLPSWERFRERMEKGAKEDGGIAHTGQIYRTGSRLARILKLISEVPDGPSFFPPLDSKKQLGKAIIASLAHVKNDLVIQSPTIPVQPADILKAIFSDDQKMSSEGICKILGESVDPISWKHFSKNCKTPADGDSL